jgi:hypothetical protein
MSISDLILITLSIPMVFIIIVLSMFNHAVKKSLRRASQNHTDKKD